MKVRSKIHILTCFWRRRDIIRIYLKGIERLKSEFDISHTFVVSEPEDIALMQELGYDYIMAENNIANLSAKWNTGLLSALQKKWDYLLIMGSDDLITSKGLQRLLDANANYVGYRSIYFYDQKTGGVLKHTSEKNRLIGCGRLIKREAVENTVYEVITRFRRDRVFGGREYKKLVDVRIPYTTYKHLLDLQYVQKGSVRYLGLWNDGLRSALDHSSEMNLCINGYAPLFLEGFEMVDIKGEVCITKWQNLELVSEKAKSIELDLSEEELRFLSI